MYDTIALYSKGQKARFDIKEERLNNLTGIETIKGNYENMNITQKENGIYIFGSLAKLFFDNNLETLTRKTTQLAIEKLSDGLRIKIPEANVYRIDLATNFIMKNTFEDYLSFLGEMQYYKKSFIRNSLYYENNNKVCVFYNKIKEMSRKGTKIPDDYKPFRDNNLRFEHRILHRLSREFKQETKAINLYDEAFYMKAIDKWHNSYNSIQKINKLNFNIMALTNSKSFQIQLMLAGLNFYGYDEVIRILKRNKDNLSKMQYKRLRDKINNLQNTKDLTEPEELTKELDEKVKMAVSHYR